MKKDTGTLAALKRRIQVGTRLLCIENNKRPELSGKGREVIRCQGNAFVWRQDGDNRDSWTWYPKAHELKWLDKDTFQIQMTPEFYVRLQIVA